MRLRLLPVLLVTLSVSSCADKVSRSSDVKAIRVIDIELDRPEAKPGESVKAAVIVADPLNQAQTAQYLWLACPLEFDSQAYQCSQGEEAFFDMQLTQDMPLTEFVVPSDILDPLPGSDQAPEDRNVSIGVLICAGGTIDLEKVQDTNEACRNGKSIYAYKRLVVSRAEKPNKNPSIRSVAIGDDTAGSRDYELDGDVINHLTRCNQQGKCPQRKISVKLTSDSIEKYEKTDFGNTETVTEAPYISWFATGGTFKHDRTIDPVDDAGLTWENNWNLPGPGQVQLWVVARDGRGGTDWRTFLIEVN